VPLQFNRLSVIPRRDRVGDTPQSEFGGTGGGFGLGEGGIAGVSGEVPGVAFGDQLLVDVPAGEMDRGDEAAVASDFSSAPPKVRASLSH